MPPRPHWFYRSLLCSALLFVAAAALLVGTSGQTCAADFAPPLPAYVADREVLVRAAPRATIETLPGGFVLVAPPVSDSPGASDTDPRYKLPFSQTLCIYAAPMVNAATAAPVRGLFRTITLHYWPDNRIPALHCSRLAARLLRLHREHFGHDAAFGRDEETADIWLAPGPKAGESTLGGETHGSQVYLWAAGTAPRTPLEWTRTLAHEWGHLTLPAARGFSEPEGDAAGYMGERLYLKWLHEDAAKKPPQEMDDGARPADIELYNRRQVSPLVVRWLREGGPESKALDGTNTAAMDYYIGATLAADEAFGSFLLGRALFTVLDVRPRDFLQSLTRVVESAKNLPVRLPAWVPLARGAYTIRTAETGALMLGSATIKVSAARPAPVRIEATGWRFVQASPNSALKRIVLLPATAPEPQ